MDYYEILGVDKTATKDEIKQAYRSLSKKYHPDVNDDKNATALFRLISEAYETLYNQQNRNDYDNINHNDRTDDIKGKSYNKENTEHNINNFKFNVMILRHMLWFKILLIPLVLVIRIVCYLLFVLSAFIEMLLTLAKAVGEIIGGILILFGILMFIIGLLTSSLFLDYCIGVLLIAFIGFILPHISAYLPVPFTYAKNALKSYAFSLILK